MKYLILVLFLISQTLWAQTTAPLTRVLRARTYQVESSIKFVRLSDGKVLFAKDAEKALIPASTSKLVTAAAALSALSSEFNFTTPVYYTGSIKEGVISGDLIFQGSGDPFLVSEKLWEMAIDLKFRGLTEIKGDIVLDQSLFDTVDRDKSRMQAERYSKNAYDAPILPLSVNFNTFAIASSVDLKTSKPTTEIWPYPLNGLISIKNNLVASSSGTNIKAERNTSNSHSTITVDGYIHPKDGVQKLWKSVSDGSRASGEYIRSFLQAVGIKVNGKIRVVNAPHGHLQLLYTIEGYPLSKAISGLNKYSNNFIADMLTKYLGSLSTAKKSKGTFSGGAQALSQFMRTKLNIKSNFTLENGSGLSLKNRLSADQLCSLLIYMQNHIELFPEFLASLPSAGIDGTLKTRFKNYSFLKGKVRAKTGTLTQPQSVSSLAGYLHHKTHGWVAFAIIENGQRGKKQPSISSMRNIQEKLIYNL